MEYRKNVKDLNKKDYSKSITNFLKRHKDIAFTNFGIMNELFGVKKSELEGEWYKEMRNIYTIVNRTLNQLAVTDFSFIHKKSEGRTGFYWYDNTGKSFE